MKKIHQIYISDNNAPPSKYVANQMQKLKHMYSDYEYTLYNNEMCRDQLRGLAGEKAVKLYDSLNSYAFRADLARYCILYQQGGFYFDSAICPEFKLEFGNFPVMYRAPIGACRYGSLQDGQELTAIENGVMYFNRPQYKFLKDAITLSLINIKQQSYGDHPLDITGPVMLGRLKTYNIHFGQSKFLDKEQQDVHKTNKAAYFQDQLHWLYKPDSYELATFKCVGTNSYHTMWDERQLFKQGI